MAALIQARHRPRQLGDRVWKSYSGRADLTGHLAGVGRLPGGAAGSAALAEATAIAGLLGTTHGLAEAAQMTVLVEVGEAAAAAIDADVFAERTIRYTCRHRRPGKQTLDSLCQISRYSTHSRLLCNSHAWTVETLPMRSPAATTAHYSRATVGLGPSPRSRGAVGKCSLRRFDWMV